MMKAIANLLILIGKALGGSEYELPEPEIEPAGTITLYEASSILLDVMDAMGDTSGAEIYLPDEDIKVYYKDEVKVSNHLSEVSAITYVAEIMDCDDFAARLYGHFAGLVWTMKHALCWFISEENEFYFIEPQTGKISKTLEGWQGCKIRFFLGR